VRALLLVQTSKIPMRRINNRSPIRIDVHIHANEDAESKVSSEKFTPIDKDIPKKLGIFSATINYSYNVDVKFFNDQVRNAISLPLFAVGGAAIIRSVSCDTLPQIGGWSLIIASILLFAFNLAQIFIAIIETIKHKAKGLSSAKTLLAASVATILCAGIYFGITGFFEYSLKKYDPGNNIDVCSRSFKSPPSKAVEKVQGVGNIQSPSQNMAKQ
jgi:hypothetical protein